MGYRETTPSRSPVALAAAIGLIETWSSVAVKRRTIVEKKKRRNWRWEDLILFLSTIKLVEELPCLGEEFNDVIWFQIPYPYERVGTSLLPEGGHLNRNANPGQKWNAFSCSYGIPFFKKVEQAFSLLARKLCMMYNFSCLRSQSFSGIETNQTCFHFLCENLIPD